MTNCFLLAMLLATLPAAAQNPPTTASANLGVTGANHVALSVKDLPAAAAFYRDILGLEPIPVPDDLKAIRAWFKIGPTQQIHLLAGRTQPLNDDRNGRHFAVFVRSIAQAETFLKARNIPYHAQTRFDGVRQIYLPDPDGHLVELNEAK